MNLINRLFNKITGKQCDIYVVSCSCECGKFSKCCRKIQSSWDNRSGTGRIWIDKKDQYRCGKIQKIVKDMETSFHNYY